MRQWFVLLAKLFSVVLLVEGWMIVAGVLPQVVGGIRMGGFGILLSLAWLAHGGGYLVAFWLLARKTEWLADRLLVPDQPLVSAWDDVGAWRLGVRLIGLFYTIHGLSRLGRGVFLVLRPWRPAGEVMDEQLIRESIWTELPGPIILLALGLVALCHTDKVIALLAKPAIPNPPAG